MATLQLVEHGSFALDTSVIGYLGLQETGISTAVTPYHLLTHTSGIADEEAGGRYEDLFLERPNYSVMETVDYLPQFVGKPARGSRPSRTKTVASSGGAATSTPTRPSGGPTAAPM